MPKAHSKQYKININQHLPEPVKGSRSLNASFKKRVSRESETSVRVFSRNGTELEPCSSCIARQLLRGGKAMVKKARPFAIKLTVTIGRDEQHQFIKNGTGVVITRYNMPFQHQK